jgi:hypothetical protein
VQRLERRVRDLSDRLGGTLTLTDPTSIRCHTSPSFARMF